MICGGCKEDKPEESFCRSKTRKTGRQFYCKSCAKIKNLKRYHDKISNDPLYKSKKALYDKKRREEKGDLLREYDKVRAKLPHRKAAHAEETRRRRAKLKKSTPSWLTKEQKKQIQQIYEMSIIFGERFNMKYHVDHIVPLNGENVCGLHVPWNLQLLEQSLNLAKNNKLEVLK